MCAYNEQARIARAVYEILATVYPCDVELIVVDDGSTDATAAIVDQFNDPRVILRRHAQNLGKGAALRTACSAATGTHVLPFDADLEYSSEDIPRLIEPLILRGYDVVYGVRLFGVNTVYRSYRYAVGNKLLTAAVNVLYDAKLSDLHTCLKLVPLHIFRSLRLRESGFGLDTELTASLLRLGMRPFEVPVSYYSRSHAQGKKITWRDAVACLGVLLRVRVTRPSRLRLTVTERQQPWSNEELRPTKPLPVMADGRERPRLALAAADQVSLKGADQVSLKGAGHVSLNGNGAASNGNGSNGHAETHGKTSEEEDAAVSG